MKRSDYLGEIWTDFWRYYSSIPQHFCHHRNTIARRYDRQITAYSFCCYFAGIVYGILRGEDAIRDKVNHGGISVWRSLCDAGLLIALVASAVYVAARMVIIGVFYPNFMDDYAKRSIEKAESLRQECSLRFVEKMAEIEKMEEMYKNPFKKMLFNSMEIFR